MPNSAMPNSQMDTPEVAFFDVAPERCPFIITFFRLADGKELASVAVSGLGATLIPTVGPAGTFGTFVDYADGDYGWYVPEVGVL